MIIERRKNAVKIKLRIMFLIGEANMVAMPVTTLQRWCWLLICVFVWIHLLHSILTYCVRVHQTMAVIMCYVLLYHVSFNLHISQFNCPNERNTFAPHNSFFLLSHLWPGVRVCVFVFLSAFLTHTIRSICIWVLWLLFASPRYFDCHYTLNIHFFVSVLG